MKKAFIKSCIAIILAITMLLSVTSCTIGRVVEEVNEHVESTNDNLDNFATSNVENTNNRFNYFSASNVESECFADDTEQEVLKKEIAVMNNVEASAEFVDHVIKESSVDSLYTATECTVITPEQNIFGLATDCIAYDFYDAGYDVFQAFAIVGEEMVPGIAFTEFETYEKSENMTIYNCGFVQLTESGVDEDIAITKEDVENGVVVIPYGECDANIGFVISIGVSLASYSGIYDGYYFRYDQVSDYAVSISVQDNDRSVWDEEIDLYNFTESKFVFKGNMSYNGTSASPYFSDEAKAYAAAREAINKIIEYQNSNSYQVESQVIIVFTEDVLNEYILNNQQGTINGFLLEQINEIKVAENQFVVVSTEGISIETLIDTDALARERRDNGIISLLGSLALTAGAVFVTVVSCGTATPLAVSAICVVAGASATLYGVSQMTESIQEIYYGATGDIYTQSCNPVLECFKAAISDEEVATKIYHAWGIGSSLLPSLILPASAAISLSNAAKAAGATVHVWSAVGRAVGVEIAKMAISGAVAAGVGYGSNLLITEITGNELAGRIVGFGSSLVAGMFAYNGLNKLDAKYNFSGLHSKTSLNIEAQKRKDLINELKQRNEKFAEENIVFIDRDSSGKIIWLEKGNQNAGLEHILHGNPAKGTKGHEADFLKAFGVSKDQLPAFLQNAIKSGNYTVIDGARIYSIPNYDKSLSIIIGDNGFIVTAFPCR